MVLVVANQRGTRGDGEGTGSTVHHSSTNASEADGRRALTRVVVGGVVLDFMIEFAGVTLEAAVVVAHRADGSDGFVWTGRSGGGHGRRCCWGG
jgi:hypothetical protein